MKECLFCRIVQRTHPANIVYENEEVLAFLDHRPLFPGHCLLISREHVATLGDLPDQLITPIFRAAQLLAGAIETALKADGTFVAMNNKVSQSVPHMHIHIVPRRRKDGLRGFFWPRQAYASEEAMREVQEAIKSAVGQSK